MMMLRLFGAAAMFAVAAGELSSLFSTLSSSSFGLMDRMTMR